MAKRNRGGYEVVVSGVREIEREMGRLKKAVRNRIVRNAMKRAHKPVKEAAKKTAPKDTGLLRKSLGGKVKTYRKHDITVAIVGPRKGYKREVAVGAKKNRRRPDARKQLRNPVAYSHLVERGTKRGVKATRFLERAYRSTLSRMSGILRKEVWEGLRAEAAKSRK